MSGIERVLSLMLTVSKGIFSFLQKLIPKEADLTPSSKSEETVPAATTEAVLPTKIKETVAVIEKEAEVEKEIEVETVAVIEKEVEVETVAVIEKEVEVEIVAPVFKVEKTIPKINKQLPQDSTLRRHYLAHLKMMLEVIYTGCPTESALKRHHETFIEAKIEDCLNDKDKLAQLVLNYEIIKTTLKQEPLIVETVAEIKHQPQETASCHKETLPEEGVQRRHYLTNLRSIIESNYASCPTDSALKRHYEAMINAEIETYLA